ncbi:MAG: hypothetical protein KatS3mg062_1094 [Tepidiforma sp.]|nr:MAG: hypothetical protein KatS3mg062_1094 [Tepidiforma sp.]
MSAGPIALFGPGGEPLRGLALALAEAGHPLGLATLAPVQAEEFATASIANELWVLGEDHLHRVLDAADPAAASAFLAELEDRFGPLAAVVVDPGPLPDIPFDEFSPDEWLPAARARLAAPLVALHAAAPLLERRGGGTAALIRRQPPRAAAGAVLAAALDALPQALAAELAGRQLRTVALDVSTGPVELLSALRS